MKKFKFRLERILQFRKTIESDKKRLLMLAHQKLFSEQERLSMLEQAERENRIAPDAVLPAQEVFLKGLFAAKLVNDIVHQRLAIIQAEEAVEAALIEYQAAAKDAKAMVTLKDRRRTEYDDYVLKEEGKFLDELTVQKRTTFKKNEAV